MKDSGEERMERGSEREGERKKEGKVRIPMTCALTSEPWQCHWMSSKLHVVLTLGK